jgi:hypothetical protein
MLHVPGTIERLTTKMAGYKEPGLGDRRNASANARAKAIEALKAKAKAPVDPAVLAERIARAEAKEKAEAEKRAAAQQRREEEKAEKARIAAEKANVPPPPSQEEIDAQRKALRDARYAARKARKK